MYTKDVFYLLGDIAFYRMGKLKSFDFPLEQILNWVWLTSDLCANVGGRQWEIIWNFQYKTVLNFSSHKLHMQWPQSKLKMNLSNSSKVKVQIRHCFEKTFVWYKL